MAMDPVGELSGFPLILCPDCGLARVVEGHSREHRGRDGGRQRGQHRGVVGRVGHAGERDQRDREAVVRGEPPRELHQWDEVARAGAHEQHNLLL